MNDHELQFYRDYGMDHNTTCYMCLEDYDNCDCEKTGRCIKCPRRAFCYLEFKEDLYDREAAAGLK